MDLTTTADSLNPIRIVAIMEASTVTGPAKNLIEFCRRASRPDADRPDLPLVDPLILTYVREGVTAPSQFLSALASAGLSSQVIHERSRFDFRGIRQLRERIAAHQPHVVQTHSVKSHFLFRVAGLHRLYPWLAFHHGYTATDLKMKAYNQLDRWSLQAPRLIVTVCGPFADELVRSGVRRNRIRILHNSVRLPQPPAPGAVDAVRRSLGLTGEESVILAVGRFSYEKAHVDLIAAFAELKRIAPERPVALVLVGDGPERRNIESAIASANLTSQVFFAGQVSDVQPFYALASILALPSHSEGSPNVVLEAMAAGVPVVATAVGGVPELLTHEATGLLVEPRASPQMAAALHRLLSDQVLARQLAERARQRIAADFQPENYRRSLVEIYRKMTRPLY